MKTCTHGKSCSTITFFGIIEQKVEGLEKIACMFNGMAGLALAGLIAAALRRAFNRKRKSRGSSC